MTPLTVYYVDEPKKNHLHAVSRLKAVNEEEDQGKKSRKKVLCG